MQQPMVAAAPANPGFTPMVPGMMAQQSAQYIETPTGQRVPTQMTGYAAQPFEVDQGTPIDSNAARAAAQAAVAAKRATQ